MFESLRSRQFATGQFEAGERETSWTLFVCFAYQVPEQHSEHEKDRREKPAGFKIEIPVISFEAAEVECM